MRLLWTLFKIAIAIAIAIPVTILAMGIVGTLVGLVAAMAKLAVFGLVGYGLYRLARAMLGSTPKSVPASAPKALPHVDPYYEAAMRELDSELKR